MVTPTDSLTRVDSHFRFGENWRVYAAKADEAAISEAEKGLQRLVGTEIKGKRVLDIGCGSGVHSVAALRLGATQVHGVDLDPDSIAAAKSVLARYATDGPWNIEEKSIFDMRPLQSGCFDIVYSWGVLHHTGDMFRAVRAAADLVASDGLFVFALYRKTWFCPFWKWEKRWYAHASSRSQQFARHLYTMFFRLGLWVTGRGFGNYVATYKTNRGMDFYHDVHDWLGGWPYESISEDEVEQLMQRLGFEPVRSFVASRQKFLGRPLGLLGSGCDEYVYRRK